MYDGGALIATTCSRAVFLEWCGVQEAAAVADDVLIQMIHKYMQLCEASQHIYSMGSILHKKVRV